MTEIERFVKDRDKAITEFVMNDNWNAIVKHCKKYKQKMPKDKEIAMAGIYKACVGCTNIPDDVKRVAIQKCRALGFSPYMY